jgi:uroporphyrinogen-III synthase
MPNSEAAVDGARGANFRTPKFDVDPCSSARTVSSVFAPIEVENRDDAEDTESHGRIAVLRIAPNLASTLVRLAARVGNQPRSKIPSRGTSREETGSFVATANTVRRLPSSDLNEPLSKPSRPQGAPPRGRTLLSVLRCFRVNVGSLIRDERVGWGRSWGFSASEGFWTSAYASQSTFSSRFFHARTILPRMTTSLDSAALLDSPPPLRVCSFESRKQDEMRALIERHGGIATIAPSMREVPLENNLAAIQCLTSLRLTEFDAIIFMTGVGARVLLEIAETQMPRAEFFEALQGICVVTRGPKPTAVLREWGVKIDHRVPEPNTWREILAVVDSGLNFPCPSPPEWNLMDQPLHKRMIAIQEYGLPSTELYSELQARGATVVPVPVYRWELPTDTAPLEAAIQATVAKEFDVLLFTSAQQIRNLLEVAERLQLRDPFLDATRRCFVASIGPTCSDALRDAGLDIDLEPSHPHMGHLVRESLSRAI